MVSESKVYKYMYILQGNSCLGKLMDRGAWQATVHGTARVGDDLATKQPYQNKSSILTNLNSFQCL